MVSPLEQFGRTAKRLAQNPLGVIALFLVLVYGIAGLVLGVSSKNLEPIERQPLIWFLVLFPVIVLVVFYLLVTKHHFKLYAPRDFPDREGFFRVLTPNEQKQKLEKDIREIEVEEESITEKPITSGAMEGIGFLKGLTIRHAWVLAEEFAIRELENEFGIPIQRNVGFGPDYGVDGVFLHKGIKIIQIKYIRRPNLLKIFQQTVESFRLLTEKNKGPISFIIAFVVEDLPQERREREIAKINNYLKSTSLLQIELRIYNFDELKKKYGIEINGN